MPSFSLNVEKFIYGRHQTFFLFMAELEEETLKESEYKLCLWEHGQNKLVSFLDKINRVHPTIKFTAE